MWTDPGTTCGRHRVTGRPPVGNARRSRATGRPGTVAPLWDPVDPGGTATPRLTRHDRRVIPNPQPLPPLLRLRSNKTTVESESGVKFRCERDVLVEALGTAGRAAAGRGTPCRCCPGSRCELVGRPRCASPAPTSSSRSRSRSPVSGEADGVVVLPGPAGLRHRAGAARRAASSVEVDRRRGARSPPARSEFSLRVLPADEFPRLTEADRRPGHARRAPSWPPRSRQVVRAASSDDARPILTGVLLAAEAGGLRLVATDSYRLAVRDLPGTTVLGEGQHVLVPSRALQELARLPRPATTSSSCAWASARPASRSAAPASPPC